MFHFARNHVWDIILFKTCFCLVFWMENAEKIEKYRFKLQKWVKNSFDNRNEIFRGDFYNDFMLYFAPNHIWKIVLCKTNFLYCFARENSKKKENTVSDYKKGSNINFDNWNEIFRDDLYSDFMLHFASNHVCKHVLRKRAFSLQFWAKKVKKKMKKYRFRLEKVVKNQFW